MAETMNFPETFDEFAESYKIIDDKQVYTNGTELIPINRVRQWLMRPPTKTKSEVEAEAEAVKEFAKRFEKNIKDVKFTLGQAWEIQNALKKTLKEMVGENNDRKR